MVRTRQEVLAEFRTGEILRAASRVFAEKGFDGATVEDVAHAAGVAKGTVYLYFASKQDVYQAAFARNIADLKERTLAAIAAAPTVPLALLAFIDTRLAYFEEHRAFFAVYLAESGRTGLLRGLIEAARLEEIGQLTELLQRAMDDGVVRVTGARAAAFAVLDLAHSVGIQRMRGWTDATADDATALVFDLIWKGLAAP
jgi:AcrR family transcriptional regulator